MGGWIPSDRQQANQYTAKVEARIMTTMRARLQELHQENLALRDRTARLEKAIRELAASVGGLTQELTLGALDSRE